jgi:cytochrome c oxidase subunit 2
MTAIAFGVFVTAMAIILAVFAVVARSTQDGHEPNYGAANRLRFLFFVALTALLIVFLGLTIGKLPYPVSASTPDRVIEAVGKQYAWSLTEGRSPTLARWDTEFSPVATVPVGSTVEFRVTTLDVNHGFSLYAPGQRLVAQTQAMPGYVNRLRVTFDQRGTYTVLCLEFCGMAHHRMRAVVEVN